MSSHHDHSHPATRPATATRPTTESSAPSPTRRALLKAGGLGLFSLGLAGSSPAFLSRAAWAAKSGDAATSQRKTLVTIFQRGAMDGLAAVQPLRSQTLEGFRPGLTLPGVGKDGGLIELKGTGFGMHPALSPLSRLFQEGQLGVVHAVGSPDPTRSHFDAQDYMETGTPGDKGTRSGWLNRVAGELGHEGTPFRSLAMTGSLPKSLYGPEPAVAVSRLEHLRVSDNRGLPSGGLPSSGQGFESLYQQTSQELLREAGQDTFAVVEALASVQQQVTGELRSSVTYPRSVLGSALRQIALLIKAQVGLEVAFAESGGWDTHVQQGSGNGTFANRARDLAESISAFWTDLGPFRDRVALMTMTEFGRTVRQNGSGGTDHGHGSCLFVLGEKVRGGKVHGDFSVDSSDLYEDRDLAVTTDFRSVFSGVARDHLQVPGKGSRTEIFPGWNGKPMRLLRT